MIQPIKFYLNQGRGKTEYIASHNGAVKREADSFIDGVNFK